MILTAYCEAANKLLCCNAAYGKRLLAMLRCSIFTARRDASTAYAVVVCLSVCLSHAGIVSKRPQRSSWFFCFRVSLDLCYAAF